MIKGILAVILGMLMQTGLARLGSLWPQPTAADPNQPPAAVVQLAANDPTPPAPDAQVTMGGPFGRLLGGCGPVAPLDRTAMLQAAADALGLTPEALQTALDQGQSLGEVAEAQGVSRETVAAALKASALASYQAQLEAAVAAGDLTQAQAEARLAELETEDFAAWLDRPFGFAEPAFGMLPFGDGRMPRPGEGGLTLGMGSDFGFHFSYRANDGEPFSFDFDRDSEAFRAAVAGALGLSQDEVADRLATGETLDAMAAAQNVPMADLQAALRAALLTAAQGELAAAVADGRLTQAQADEIAEQLQQMASFEVFAAPNGLPGLPGHVFPWAPEDAPKPQY